MKSNTKCSHYLFQILNIAQSRLLKRASRSEGPKLTHSTCGKTQAVMFTPTPGGHSKISDVRILNSEVHINGMLVYLQGVLWFQKQIWTVNMPLLCIDTRRRWGLWGWITSTLHILIWTQVHLSNKSGLKSVSKPFNVWIVVFSQGAQCLKWCAEWNCARAFLLFFEVFINYYSQNLFCCTVQ